ncbi:MAG: hypothetical protein KF798_01860 [Candidatus Paracaedibacteraceae bacterium]|nr:hypothetical protein [Candidatus Paracaedibacteraceae bacterium]
MTAGVLRILGAHGIRIFCAEDIQFLSEEIGISKTYIRRMLSLMAQKEEIVSYGQGLYSLPIELLAGSPIHSFEIALKLARKGSISYRSALQHYNLTDQFSNTIYITVPKETGANLSSNTEYKINGVIYKLIRINPKKYWGIKNEFIDEIRISITDIERTLIDCLSHPEFCSGMREVIFAFEKILPNVDISKLFNYATSISIAVSKRLGWILNKLGQLEELQVRLKEIPANQYQKLDPNHTRSGKYNKSWMIVENI